MTVARLGDIEGRAGQRDRHWQVHTLLGLLDNPDAMRSPIYYPTHHRPPFLAGLSPLPRR